MDAEINDSIFMQAEEAGPALVTDETQLLITKESEAEGGMDGEVIIGGGADKIHIADEVINQIIIMAAGRVQGVALTGAGEGLAGFLGMKGATKGVRLETDEKSVGVDISVSVEYGRKLNEAAKALQEAVRGDLADMTGMEVTHVNVHVLTINTKDAAAGKPQKPVKQQKEQPADPASKDDARVQQAANPAPAEPPANAAGQAQGQ